MDLKKVLDASKLIIIIGTVLVLVKFLLQLGAVFLPSGIGAPVAIINAAYSLLLLIAFFALFAWAGFRAVRDYGMDLVGAGLVSVLSYVAVAIIDYLLGILGMLFAGGKIALSQPAGSMAFAAVMAGAGGIMSTLCSIVVVFCGVVLNFAVGAAGGAIVGMLAKKK